MTNNGEIPVGDEQLAGVSENPIRCPACGSTDVVVLCHTIVEYTVEGNLGQEQDFLREDVADDTAEPYGARCRNCQAIWDVEVEGAWVAALVAGKEPKAASSAIACVARENIRAGQVCQFNPADGGVTKFPPPQPDIEIGEVSVLNGTVPIPEPGSVFKQVLDAVAAGEAVIPGRRCHGDLMSAVEDALAKGTSAPAIADETPTPAREETADAPDHADAD